jgi:hypothetical protein
MGIVDHPQHFGKWVREKRGGDYFTCYGRYLISNWIFSMKAKTNVKLPASVFVCLFLFIYVLFLQAFTPRVNSK